MIDALAADRARIADFDAQIQDLKRSRKFKERSFKTVLIPTSTRS
jgi:hypothetical protein